MSRDPANIYVVVLLVDKNECNFVYLMQKLDHPCPSALSLLNLDWTEVDGIVIVQQPKTETICFCFRLCLCMIIFHLWLAQ